MEKLISLKKAAEILCVSKETLRRYDREGKLKALKTAGGHRRYRESDIEQFLGIK